MNHEELLALLQRSPPGQNRVSALHTSEYQWCLTSEAWRAVRISVCVRARVQKQHLCTMQGAEWFRMPGSSEFKVELGVPDKEWWMRCRVEGPG